MITRCINLDWLECYCLEDYIGYPHDANYFRKQGFRVIEREYGTPVYHEMFTVCSYQDDQPMIEIRRNPKSAIGKQVNGVLDPQAAHVRLTNRFCYVDGAAKLMQQFIEQYGFHFQRISRIDVCLDFELFDYGDKPAVFIDRYFKGRYAKINQTRIRANGRDMWDGRLWNSVAWANPKSMVGTKFYNKTMELEERADKPYIRQAWRVCGLVDDDYRLTKCNDDGTERKVDVWRVEFSIKLQSRKNTLSMYYERSQLLDIFFSLTEHYFHFKRVEYIEHQRGLVTEAQKTLAIDYTSELAKPLQNVRRLQRKDRCSDKLLFNTRDRATFYKLETVRTNASPEARFKRLMAMLEAYRDSQHKPEIYKACNVILEELEFTCRTASINAPWPKDELWIIRQLLSKRFRDKTNSITDDIATMQAYYEIEQNLFKE